MVPPSQSEGVAQPDPDTPRAGKRKGDPQHAEVSASGVAGAPRAHDQDDDIAIGHLPPMGLLLARPLLLIISGVVGLILGAALSGGSGYKAETVLEFSSAGTDSVFVKQTGQTLARTAVARNIVEAAQAARGQEGGDLARRVSAEWSADTSLVAITVTATTDSAAVADANAIAKAVVDTTEATIAAQLKSARDESNSVLKDEQLDVADAEAARRAQLGSALAARQDAIASQSGDLFVADAAVEASPAGLTRSMGAAVGLVAGLLLGGLASLLLGLRGLRAHSARGLRQLLPQADISTPAQAAQLAGRAIDSGTTAIAVVYTDDARRQGVALAGNITGLLRAHGKDVIEVGPFDGEQTSDELRVLQHRFRENLRESVGTDMVVFVVGSGSESSSLLEGQSNLRALVVMRRGRTPISSALRAVAAYGRADPTIVLAR
ncbi:hypothetical protein ACVBEQ_11375 [Nakamurella sp. GG22]